MANADSIFPTILIIRPDTSGTTPGAGPADKRKQWPDADLVFVQATLQQSNPRQETRLSNYGLVSRFPAVDEAFEAACALQQAWTERGQYSTTTSLCILVDRASESPFGETHQYLLEQAFPGQIVATKTVIGHLSEASRARLQVVEQNSAEQLGGIELYRVICDEATITRIALSTLHQENSSAPRCLCLRWRENTMDLQPNKPRLTIGRGDESDIRIDSDLTSRIHAHLGFHETNFVLEDRSTNGTFVKIEQDDEVFLHNEQIVLRGSGVISLGCRIQGGRGKLIYFKLAAQDEQARD